MSAWGEPAASSVTRIKKDRIAGTTALKVMFAVVVVASVAAFTIPIAVILGKKPISESIAACTINPCQNGGICSVNSTTSPYYQCSCALGTSGVNCSTSVGNLTWNTTGVVVITITDVPFQNGIYIKNGIIYTGNSGGGVSGQIIKTTSSLNSTVYPYTTSVVVTGLASPTWPIIDSQGVYMYIPDTDVNTVYRYFLGSSTTTNYSVLMHNSAAQSSVDMFIAFDSTESNIYVSDDRNNRVLMYPVNATNATIGLLVAGSNSSGNAATQLSGNQGIYYDPASNYLYIANLNGHSVSRWTPGASNGTFIIGIPGSSGSALTKLNQPFSVTMDKYSNLYVADYGNHRVMGYCAGTYTNNLSSGISLLGNLGYGPQNIAFDSSMNLYLNDWDNNLVYKFAKL
ncbi:unnamed protein product [Didymodactylos carnosus]|uniref:EGF-like domain-containing protein n=2 Tax=Didymodactylos carnosus TaxID=1234261 RepID=A0A8S2CMF9_9BILA|nr:unnamed protein product [Didymodactylos carnosus]CAF3528625.1 unnamed protein product [Didymodactylos carnosus]